MSKPIPKHLLIHTVTLKTVTGVDAYGNETVTEKTIYHVRLEPAKQTKLTQLGEAKDDKYLMFWDSVHSTPADFPQLSKVVFDGIELTVRLCNPEYDEHKLHHNEVFLT